MNTRPRWPISSASKLTTNRRKKCSFATRCCAGAVAPTQRQLFAHRYCQFGTPHAPALIFSACARSANYPQNVRIAALNLGAKVIELAGPSKFADGIPDKTLQALFQSQLAETRSHILMGRFQVERFIEKAVDTELARRLCAETRRDYLFFLEETARFVLGMEEEKAGEVTVQADID